ncbi:protein Daple [Bacillus rossius redtenbacheri]|uniref:protein Daple n=1 Tax=Bacillus rossius redtenbacheri TaxID=93214 RepID=UPI002FDDBF90
MALTEVEDLMSRPLVSWFCSCLDSSDTVTDYEDLADGVLIYKVLLQIDPEPVHHGVVPSLGNTLVRIRNMDIIIRNIKTLYEEEFCQVVLALPDSVRLGQVPTSRAGIEDMQLLLLLLLGCAVQSPSKELFIERIKQMSVDDQHAIVECIKQVTDQQEIVLTQEVSELLQPDLMLKHIRRLVRERDKYLQNWTGMVTQERADAVLGDSPTGKKVTSPLNGSDSHHLSVELADWKARFRKLRQELEEKSEALAETREELEDYKLKVTKLKQEVQELTREARAAKAYRDELDAMRERAERAGRLELEAQRYREKLGDFEFYKTRVEELREDNRVLLETREMLEEQLGRARQRGDQALALEAELMRHRQEINDLTIDKDVTEARLRQLFEENAQLRLLVQASCPLQPPSPGTDGEAESLDAGSGSNSLSEQLTTNAQARALKLELENRRLLSTIDSLKEESFHQSNSRILDLEKDKKLLSIKLEELQESCERLTQQNSDLEKMFKNALGENKLLHESVEKITATNNKHIQDLQASKRQAGELEAGLAGARAEKQRLQLQLADLERRLEGNCAQLERWRGEAGRAAELEARHAQLLQRSEALEKEVQGLQRELARARQAVEEKEVALDRCASEAEAKEKELTQLAKELNEAGTQVSKLQGLVRDGQEAARGAAADRDALAALQARLIAHKKTEQQARLALERIGLELEQLLDPDTLLERLAGSAEVRLKVKELLAREGEEPQGRVEKETMAHDDGLGALQGENARLQVEVATLQSQVTSLATQHTALQLANSQLAAEKVQLLKERTAERSAHEQLAQDQVMLRGLHEALAGQYEALARERDGARTQQRELRAEVRSLRQQLSEQEAEQARCRDDQERLRSLDGLRTEHSRLKDDFRNLFTASEKLKHEYRTLQDQHRALRVEAGTLKLRSVELKGELAVRTDQLTALEVDMSKLTNRCKLLLHMNSGLEEDRRSLMDHVSRLLSQYHELLTHSLEDKEHHHLEERLFTDKVNNLCRQKEKLEEKIMEHYRKMESCSTKKKSFGASLVRRVKKAGSDLINKVPRSRQSWHEGSQQEEGVKLTMSHTHPCISEPEIELCSSSEDVRPPSAADGERDPDSLAQSTLSLGSTGTRRAVYYTGDKSQSRDASPSGSQTLADREEAGTPTNQSSPASSSQNGQSDRYVVYNRVTTVVGAEGPRSGSPGTRAASPGQASQTPSKAGSDDAGRKAAGKEKAKESSIWYEYGCV